MTIMSYFKDKDGLRKALTKAEFDRDYYKNLYNIAVESRDEVSESNNDLRNKISELETKVSNMQLFKDDGYLDEMAFETAKEINDIFVRPWNGVGQRTANIQILIRSLLNRGLTGSSNGK